MMPFGSEQKGSLRAAFLLLLWLAATPVFADSAAQPEPASGELRKSALAVRRYVAVSANDHASAAAEQVLAAGGNALDAALAAQWVLNLVEPQSSGIGGGGFLLYWDAKHQRLHAWDGRETAPRAANADFARHPDGTLARFDEVVATGKSVGTPGLVAMLATAHRQYGKRSWASSFRPAIRLAEQGFAVSPRLHQLLAGDTYLRRNAAAASLYYHADGSALAAGERLRNPALARSLRLLAQRGPGALYQGALAERIVHTAQQAGGTLSAEDLRAYRALERTPVCSTYRGYRLCGMPPPSSGGITLLQLLGVLERSGGPLDDLLSPAQAHRFTEAGRLAFADRARYLADPDFVAVPQAGLLADAYLHERAALIDPARSLGVAPAGMPEGAAMQAGAPALEIPATTHLSIVDAEGNAVAMTSSIEAAFGSRLLVEGFLLNNQLTDFSFVAERDGAPVANRLQPGKRPLSSMAPTLVFAPDGRLWAVLGSPGGQRIINYVAQTVLALIDAGLAPDAALAQAHLGSRNGPSEIETGPQAEALAASLRALGHTPRIDDMSSGTHLIVRAVDGKGWLGAADPRREGTARGR